MYTADFSSGIQSKETFVEELCLFPPCSRSRVMPSSWKIFSLAPMMEYTDRHMRFLLRLLTRRTVLWTEMVPSTTLAYNADDLDRFLAYNDGVEHPVVLQVSMGDPICSRCTCPPFRSKREVDNGGSTRKP